MANQAAEIRIRAERKLGEMIRGQKETVGLNKGGGDRKSEQYHQSPNGTGDSTPTLAEVGISKKLSSRALISLAVSSGSLFFSLFPVFAGCFPSVRISPA